VHEQGVIGTRADHANRGAIFLVPAGESVDDVQLLPGVEIVDGAFAIDLKSLLVDRDVDGPPPYFIFGIGMLNNPFVGGRTLVLIA